MKIERKYSNGGCMKNGIKMAIVVLIITLILFGCTTQKEGCPDSARWEAKHKFRSK